MVRKHPEILLIDSLLDSHIIIKVSRLKVYFKVVGFMNHCKESVKRVSPKDGALILLRYLEK